MTAVAKPSPVWTAAEARAATGGIAEGAWTATGVSIDSRSVATGDLFVAIRGPVFDGHDFVAAAMANGAAAAMVDHRPEDVVADAPMLVVDDTMAGLEALARAARRRAQARIVAVTGSVGKTGVKEALRHVLSRQGETTASASSLNNHWGVPLSVARMPAGARFGVFEIGMNHPGEITPLSQLVRPHVAIVTTVEAAHTEFFSSVAQIAEAKAEIFEGLDASGVAVLNRDNPHYDLLATRAREAGAKRIIAFGRHAEADARLIDDARADNGGRRVRAILDGRETDYVVGMPGAHWAMNSLAVLAAVAALGADTVKAASALADLKPLPGRGRIHRLKLADGECTLVDESYNANPASMRAAIATLAETPVGPGGRRIAVLGDMRELGADSAAMHAELAQVLTAQGIDLAFTAGAEMTHLRAALPADRIGGWADSGADLSQTVRAALRPGDVVMVKGSNASGMKAVVDALVAENAAPQETVNA